MQTDQNDDSGIEQHDNGEDIFKDAGEETKHVIKEHIESKAEVEQRLDNESEEESDCCEMTTREKQVNLFNYLKQV